MDTASDDAEIVRLIERLTTNYDDALQGLLAVGEPALHRLLRVMDGSAPVSLGKYPLDAIQNRGSALAMLGRSNTEALVAAIQGGTVRMTLPIITAIGAVGDERLTAIAKQALKEGDF